MIVTFGDSVTWGQGLLDVHKFDRIVAGPEGLLLRPAHSGALLGAETDNSTQLVYPEIPVGYPSVWQQVLEFEPWTDVDWAIVNGGINDVSVTRIINPWVATDVITQLTQQYCGKVMGELLPVLAGKLMKPGAKVAVMGYFPIVSPLTKFDNERQPKMLLEMHGVPTTSSVTGASANAEQLIPAIVANSMAFWQTSTACLKDAVAKTNATLGREVCVFVESPLKEENALWAPQGQLWQLTWDLNAEDEVKSIRDAKCSDLYGDVVDAFPWIICDRASVGHPNVEGTARIAQSLKAAMGTGTI
ncbi:hypothetical protein ACFPT7_00775 [Acidicapsa dinghuensis]|uniref:SGNH/GDSL hydrolase family protein n=1 Tax=Acidicapsa dinghuensis TaxID=2218256 RepID=A0ABW1E9Z9_9BACT|nr:hypothetical protein [Acidicapsa dinghuensis]